MITEGEIDLGLVLHLDPDELEACGAAYSCSEEARVTGGHFFLHRCRRFRWSLDSDVHEPRRGTGGTGRIGTGHPKWTRGKFHYHPGQVWLAKHHGVVRAAAVGGDMSAPGRRNRLADEQAAIVAQAIPAVVS